MIKSRAAYLCNLKLLLIVLVVLGHSLEQVGAQGSLLYQTIYLFHMPLFSFVSGLHLKSVQSCRKQARTALLLYLPIQGAVALISALGGQRLSLLTPFWHLWYLLSLFWWSALGLLCRRLRERFPRCGVILCPVSILLALLCGALPLGRFLSLSRTVVFFPYVLLGMLCPPSLQNGPQPRTRLLLAAAGLWGLIPAGIVIGTAPYSLLYQADAYASLQLSAAEGCLLRALCFPAACGLGMVVLALVPARKLPVSKLGGDTLPAYLLHVLFLPPLALFWPESGNGWLAVFSFAVVLLLWELGRWIRPAYTLLRPQQARKKARVLGTESGRLQSETARIFLFGRFPL